MSAPTSTRTASEGAARHAEGRSLRLAWLAGVLADPDESPAAPPEFGEDGVLQRLERERATLPRAERTSAYRAIFGHTPGGPCPLYELSWLPAGDFAAEQEISDIAGFYSAFGVGLGSGVRDRVDHVAVELEFVAYLAHLEALAAREGDEERRGVAREAQQSFVRDHLGRWAPAFFLRMEERARDDWHREVTRFGQDTLERLFEELDLGRPEFPPPVPGPQAVMRAKGG